MLSVQNSVSEPIPEFLNGPKKGAEVPPLVVRQNATDVLLDEPTGALDGDDAQEFEGEVATGVVEEDRKSVV